MTRAKRPALVHPVYLDTPMLLSFVATLEDGVSLSAAVTESKSKSKTTDVSGSGEGGTESVLALLGVKLTATGEMSRSTDSDSSVEQSFTRQHTLASLFSRLVQGLIRADAVKVEPRIGEVETGDLIVFDGRIEENPLEVALTTVHGLLPLMEQFQESSEPAQPRQNRAQRRHADHPNNQLGGESGEQQDLTWFKPILETLRGEQEASTVIDLIARRDGFSSIITAKREYFSDSSRAAILDGQFKVIGKVTAVVADPSESVSLIRRGASARIEGMYQALADMLGDFDDGFVRPLPPSQMSGPLAQVLPLAIYI